MIDRTVFTREWTLLLERFGKDPHQLMTQRYFEYLDAKLTTEEFLAAARDVFENDSYWPPPVRFLHAAKGDPKQLANESWQQLLKAAQAGNPGAVPPEAIKALRQAGITFRDIETANDYRLREIQRTYLEAATNTPQHPAQPQLEETPA